LGIGLAFGEDAGKTETKRADQRRITIRRSLASIHDSRNTDSRLAKAGTIGTAVRVDGANGDIAGKTDTALADQRAGALVISGARGQDTRDADSSSADKGVRTICRSRAAGELIRNTDTSKAARALSAVAIDIAKRQSVRNASPSAADEGISALSIVRALGKN
jgi:hypothetical protein